MSEDSKDCLSCRLISSGGLLFGAAYVIYQSKKLKKSAQAVAAIGYALGSLGILRLLSLPPFRNSRGEKEDKSGEKVEQTDYIIGKHPTKF